MVEDEVGEEEYQEALRSGASEQAASPVPVAARFDGLSGRIVIDFDNGAAFMVPARLLQDLEEASDEELAAVELAGETSLHWESLDVDLSIEGLLRGVFGSARFMQSARRGGQSRSPAKVAASRANGRRGGRPRKTPPAA